MTVYRRRRCQKNCWLAKYDNEGGVDRLNRKTLRIKTLDLMKGMRIENTPMLYNIPLQSNMTVTIISHVLPIAWPNLAFVRED